MSIDIQKLISGDRRSLAKAITLTESKLDSHRVEAQKLLEDILPHTGKSLRIGISGVPGVGKSTFIETFGLYLISLGKKVAVLAVDPSSPINGGSLLGDKTRMEVLSQQNEAFIRPSPASGSLGGVAGKTREAMLLCEASGYDIILVETVGVGQSEYEVASMVDFFMVLMLPNAGDELQGIKKGILELASSIIINKADGDSINLAKLSLSHYTNALRLVHPTSFWVPRVLSCSSLEKKGLEDIWKMICDYQSEATKNGELLSKRSVQNKKWMDKLIHEMLELRLKNNQNVQKLWKELEKSVTEGKATAFGAAKQIIEEYFK